MSGNANSIIKFDGIINNIFSCPTGNGDIEYHPGNNYK
jgi:hypothetical protein